MRLARRVVNFLRLCVGIERLALLDADRLEESIITLSRSSHGSRWMKRSSAAKNLAS